jgi:nicotinate-nucleotide adenylyltransferase
MLRRVGILGGTFDPIHCGHLDLAQAADAALGFGTIMVVPSNIPPHRAQPRASSCHRFAMAALAVVGRDRWRVSDIELAAGPAAAPSFTSATLRRLQEDGYAPTELFFLTGADAFAEIETWRDYPALLDRAHFVVVSRPGFPVAELAARLPALAGRMREAADADRMAATPGTWTFLLDAPTADVSATAIRERLAGGRSIAGLVPPLVERYIEQHQLYAAGGPPAAAGRLHGHE